MKYNFNGLSDEDFRQLECKAWCGTLDYRSFPAAEYKFFDTVSELGQQHRGKKIPAELFRDDILSARREYLKEVQERSHSAQMYKKYQEAILLSDELKCRIQKAPDEHTALELALQCIELLTGENGFAERFAKR